MIVAIDASTTGCSVTLLAEDKVLVSLKSRVDRSSAENFTLMIEQVLKFGGVDFSELKAVAVAKGPGSYTGLRIAVSTAKGLAYGLDIPLISFETLQAMAHQPESYGEIGVFCPMIDARRMEVFCGFYDAQTKESLGETEAVLVDENSFSAILDKHKVLFFGEGSAKCKDVIKHPNAFFAEKVIFPDAEFALKIVMDKFRSEDFEDLVTFEPFYLKEYMFKTK